MEPDNELDTIKATIRQVITETTWHDEISGRCLNCSSRGRTEAGKWVIEHKADCPYTKLARIVGLSNVQLSDLA